ncbi:dihydrofolate reductase [mine drainage metagenome]|jgi:dihydrofolate reductase|uniref:dihydrofolate reductase n=1 Tax=mine drainage metagenome TaxID=410659 RepID=A0A1J5QPR0_9ZZZZ
MAAADEPVLTLIAAVGANGVIGRGNALIWRLRDDLAHFKRMTLGHPVLMGRKTWESLGRALPGRRNLVLSRDTTYVAAGAEVCGSLADALRRCEGEPEVFVIGGAQIYLAALPLARRLWLTEVHASADGDAHFPRWERTEFVERSRQPHAASGDAPAFDIVLYERVR